jgi:ElaA protein
MINVEVIDWKSYTFEELDLRLFHDIVALRIAVFVVEQNCPYQELDGKDLTSIHIAGKNKANEIVALARIVPPHFDCNFPSIGRVIVNEKFRSEGYGHELMQKCITLTFEKFGMVDIHLSAQAHLEQFYATHGFVSTGKTYLEDGIPHVEMIKKITQ